MSTQTANVQPSVSFEVPGDVIDSLPTDQTVPSNNEMHILDTLFKQKQGTMQHILVHSKDVLTVGLLFVILSLPQVDTIIEKLVPSTTTSPYILILIKALVIMAVYFVIKNWYLGRKK